MSLSRAPLLRPQSVVSEKSTTEPFDLDTTSILLFTHNQAPQPFLGLYASTTPYEKLSQHSPDSNTTTVVQLPSQNSTADFAYSLWRSHYSSSFKFVFAIIIMIVWPWAFYGHVKRSGGIEMNQALTNYVREHSRDADYFVVALASIISLLIGYLFQVSVTRLAQRWVVYEETDIFRLSFFSALKSRTFLWSWDVLPAIFKSVTRLALVLTVALYIVAFLLITPSITTLLRPRVLVRSVNLSGAEIDFSSRSPDCLSWFNRIYNAPLPSPCVTASYDTCQESVVDALESGRNYILSLSSTDVQSITLHRLNRAHFLGPTRGVMPIGPNGVSVFGNFSSQWPVSNIPNQYNYTLDLQGFKSNINCQYDTGSIALSPAPMSHLITYFNGSCPAGQAVLGNSTLDYPVFVNPRLHNSFGYWACLSSLPNDSESYDLHFRADGLYANAIGNITCSVSSTQSIIFPMKYQRKTDLFTISNTSSSSTSTISPVVMRRAIQLLRGIIWEAQLFERNQVADAVITLGGTIPKLERYERSEMHLRVYEGVIQGLLDHLLLYLRILLTADYTSEFSSCQRPVNGTVEYIVMGWEVSTQIAAYMIPMTLVTITSLVFILIAMFTTRKLPTFDPTNPTQLIVAASGGGVMGSINDPEATAVWQYQLRYNEDRGRFDVTPRGQ